jgi:hypothetical protein
MNIKEVEGKPMCPFCGRSFQIEVKVENELIEGDVSRGNIGVIQLVQCNGCGESFPYFRATFKDPSILNITGDVAAKLYQKSKEDEAPLERGVQVGTFMTIAFASKLPEEGELDE